MINKVTLLGRTGKDPEVRNLDNGGTVAMVSIATSETYKDKTTGEKKEKTEWHNLVFWNKLAEIVAKYIHKGDLIFVEGKMTTRKWEKDGVTRYMTEVIVGELKMISTKKPKEDDHGERVRDDQDPGPSSKDDLPF